KHLDDRLLSDQHDARRVRADALGEDFVVDSRVVQRVVDIGDQVVHTSVVQRGGLEDMDVVDGGIGADADIKIGVIAQNTVGRSGRGGGALSVLEAQLTFKA